MRKISTGDGVSRIVQSEISFSPVHNFKAWMFTIMKNIFINNYRKKVKANTILDTTDNQYYLNSGSHATSNAAEGGILLKELNAMVGRVARRQYPYSVFDAL
jgi:RNA polymerase sigma-70 factor (ECF subfamily)